MKKPPLRQRPDVKGKPILTTQNFEPMYFPLKKIHFHENLNRLIKNTIAKMVFGLLLFMSTDLFAQPPKEEMFMDINGAKIFTKAAGSGIPLLILHGGPGLSHDYLEPQLIELLAKDYRLIFFDQRASGRSSGAEDTARITIAQFVEDIESIRKNLSIEKINVLGHSFGGLLAMFYATTYPGSVDKLLLLDSSPASWEPYFPMINKAVSEKATEADKEELAKIRLLRPNVPPATMERYFKIYFRPFFNNSQLTEQLSLGVTTLWVSNYYATYPRIMNNLGHHNILDKLSAIKAPTLIIHGEDSVIPVESARETATRIPDCKLTILKNVGHFPYVEAPDAFAGAVRSFIR